MWSDFGAALQIIPAVVVLAIAVAYAVMRTIRGDKAGDTLAKNVQDAWAADRAAGAVLLQQTQEDRDYWRTRALAAEAQAERRANPPGESGFSEPS